MTMDEILVAATAADWLQVHLNTRYEPGEPTLGPCFHYEPDSHKFCLRGYRWAGHDPRGHHEHVSLEQLLIRVHAMGRRA